jgi:hypothetical protein
MNFFQLILQVLQDSLWKQLMRIQKQFNLISSNAIKIAYVSLYISAYRDKSLCYKLQTNYLSKQHHVHKLFQLMT